MAIMQTEIPVQPKLSPITPAEPKLSAIHWSLIGLLLLATSWVVFHGLKSNGIVGSDVYQYWDIALMWNDGQYVLNNDVHEYRQFFRPTYYFMNMLSVQAFGLHDYSLRLTIGAFSVISVLLVFFIGYYFFRRNFVMGFTIATVFAFIPSNLLLAQTELPHTQSATFILGMYLCYLLSQQFAKANEVFSKKWLLASGLLGGLAATTHGSTTFFGPIMVALIGLTLLFNKAIAGREKWKQIFVHAGVFTFGFAIPYIIWGAVVGYRYMIKAVRSESTIRYDTGLEVHTLFLKFMTDGPKESVSPVMLYPFWGSLIYFAWVAIRKQASVLFTSASLVVLFFALLYSVAFQNLFFVRLYLPLNLFVVLSVFAALYHFFSRFQEKAAPYLVAACMFPAGYFTFDSQVRNVEVYYRGERKGAVRATYDAIGNQVTATERLLVTPYIQYLHRPQFRAKVYFDQNASYLMECEQGTLADFVRNNQIKYVLISKEIDTRIPESKDTLYKNLGICTGNARPNYSVENDITVIQTYLKEAGATPLQLDPKEGELYRLP